VAAQSLFHAALDAVALMALPMTLPAVRPTRGPPGTRLRKRRESAGQEPAHGGGLTFTASRISALIVSVLAQTRSGERLPRRAALVRLGNGGHGNGADGVGRNRMDARPVPVPATGVGNWRGLVAEAGADGHALATDCTAAAENGCAGLGLHARAEAVGFHALARLG